VDQTPDRNLIDAILHGDTDRFTELCRRYYPAMVAIAHAILGDRHLAEDAAQVTFAKIARNLPHLRKREQFAAWAAAICRNVARDRVRTREILCTPEALQQVPDPEVPDDLGQTVREAIRRLPEPAREIIFLRYYDGMSYERMSALLGISEQALNGRLRRARQQIADDLCQNGFSTWKQK
jgi:RNA polymerase sigma-70 factor, ECF subfamily